MYSLVVVDKLWVPFDTQRNDIWTLADMYERYTGKKTKTSNVLDRVEQRDLTNALKAEDLKRQNEEAKTLLKANNIKIDK